MRPGKIIREDVAEYQVRTSASYPTEVFNHTTFPGKVQSSSRLSQGYQAVKTNTMRFIVNQGDRGCLPNGGKLLYSQRLPSAPILQINDLQQGPIIIEKVDNSFIAVEQAACERYHENFFAMRSKRRKIQQIGSRIALERQISQNAPDALPKRPEGCRSNNEQRSRSPSQKAHPTASLSSSH